MPNLSPMMQQYLEIKESHKEHILFFRLGDFYEMFFEDAVLVSKELELTLTGKDCGLDDRAPMCGVPYHSAEAYIQRLIKKGYKVAICEQMESPSAGKGVVRREVVRVITPGTLIETNMLDEGTNNFICGIFADEAGFGVAFADISTGEMYVTQIDSLSCDRVNNELGRFAPSEILMSGSVLGCKEITVFIKEKLPCTADILDDNCFRSDYAKKRIEDHFSPKTILDLGLQAKPRAVQVLGAVIDYLYQTQRKGLERLIGVQYFDDNQFMKLDISARRNLELCETMRSKEKKGSLLWVLDKTKTAMGKRMIRTFLDQPLLNPAAINKRLNAVEELVRNTALRSDAVEGLAKIYDLERIMTKVVYGNVQPRELRSFACTCQILPALKVVLAEAKCRNLTEIYGQIDPLSDLCALIDEALVDEPPAFLKDGGYIRSEFNEKLGALRDLMSNTKKYIVEIEVREKERTGIKTLKIGYNRVFGYYIEVSKLSIDLVPVTYIRKQTLANCERYITQELKELEEKVLSAADKISLLEMKIYEEVRCRIASQLHRVQATANAIARLDVFCSFAQVSVANGYIRPDVTLGSDIDIRDGRHPVVEAILHDVPFVANDTLLDNNENQIAVITGPNMAGKSTYMRQIALIVIMAQMGCFIPASSAVIGVVDGIYTRVGASDDLASGQSTFMVEMSEVAYILQNATAKSLLILDEIGRGTSTFDGMSIARAVIEYIADKKKLGAKTLFATHYHELTELEEITPCVKNYNIACKKRGDDITFLRRIVRGGADDSYGIEVSKLAGIPDWVIKRSHEILRCLEAAEPVDPARARNRVKQSPQNEQISFAEKRISKVEEILKNLDLNTLTPIEALTRLYELKAMLE